ncbi:MAG: hypothetical protein AMS25_07480 [Gemmatimonas sp. SM23_52]|nr:MAG: hypothetical protein AMS25_07480 [Gemmatimonas sp. SM23_52]
MSYEGNFDVVIEGLGSERNARVMAAPEGLYVNEHHFPYSTLLGVALRGSILLVVGTQVAMALRGSHEGLASLAAELRGRADLDHLALADRRVLEGERVVFATPVAISGLVEMERFKGMALAVVTDSGYHLFERGGRHFRIAWDRITKIEVAQAKFGRLLRLGTGPTQIEILYLTDAQIQTIRGLASGHASALLSVTAPGPPAGAPPAARDAGAAAPAPEVVEDLRSRFSIPEFEASLGAVGAGADRPLGAAIDRMQMSSLLPVGFLEEHLRELRAIYDGALLRAKREAAAARELVAAAQALDGERIWDAVLESVGVVSDATVRAFERQTRRLAANRRIPWRKARSKHMPSQKEVSGLRQRLTRGVAPMETALDAVSKAGRELSAVVEGDPSGLRAAYERWHEALRALDQAYATGWTGLSREVVAIWQDAFLPKLTRLGGVRRRLLPRWLKIAFYFLMFIVLAGLVYLYLTGQLGQVIQFE